MSVPVIERLLPLSVGVVLALYPSDPRLAGEVQRAPDSSGSPGTWVTIGYAIPGAHMFIDQNGATGPWWYRWRHVRPSSTAGAWTHAIGPFYPSAIPGTMPNVPKLRAPAVEVAWTRQASTTAALDLTIVDLDRLVTTVRFNKREGSEAADAFTGWVTTWDRSTGTIGTDGSLVRGEDVLVEAGQESIARWEVDYVDEDGGAHTLAGAQSSQNADQNETTVYWTFHGAVPVYDTGPVDLSGDYLQNRTAGDYFYRLPVRLPVGVKITGLSARVYRLDADGETAARLYRYWDNAGTPSNTNIGAAMATTTNGWQTKTVTGLSEVVAAGYIYAFQVSLANSAGAAPDERFLWATVTYVRHSQRETV